MAGLPIPGIGSSDETLVASIGSTNPPTAVCGKYNQPQYQNRNSLLFPGPLVGAASTVEREAVHQVRVIYNENYENGR